ncbi:uncharacterized protein [Dermacentor albipictus]|uniref:uncharacterized protein isoform X1 n=1 Tax=Dermacentor albipictus TaxID=60249 RepID=UPI0038FBECFD
MGTVKSSEGHCANAFDNGLLSDVCRNSELKRLREQNGFQEAPRRPMSLKCAQVESSREHSNGQLAVKLEAERELGVQLSSWVSKVPPRTPAYRRAVDC